MVRAPLHAPVRAIQDFIREKSEWINRKIAEVSARPTLNSKEFKDGERFLYRGELYPLSIVDAAPEPLFFDGVFRLQKSSLSEARGVFIAWYKGRSAELIQDRLSRYSVMSGISYGVFKITSARSRWGSCSAKNKLNFSWRLSMAPDHVLDYVVVHELAHLEHRNHSRRFWDRVANIFPLYRESEQWIKDHGYLCDVQ